jgi:hypothetical protein
MYRRSDFQQRQEVFLFLMAFSLALKPTQPPIQWALGILSLGIKKVECEADHLHPTSVKVKIEWSYVSVPPPPHAFMAWTGTTFPFFIFLQIRWFG